MAELLRTPLTVVHLIACAFLIVVILLQPGKGGGLGAFSGAGAQQVFGGRGAGNVLTRTTWVTATTFFLTSVSLAYLSSSHDDALEKRAKARAAASALAVDSAAPPAPAAPAAPVLPDVDEPAAPGSAAPAAPASPAGSAP